MFFRYKKLVGDELRAKSETSLQVESILACNILNQFRLLGRLECELLHEMSLNESMSPKHLKS
ncbi:MAG: hypothetical protein CMH49_08145 [Myxococcales bacterium]|nr:hypothetical protein [Myxococcales bacterium]